MSNTSLIRHLSSLLAIWFLQVAFAGEPAPPPDAKAETIRVEVTAPRAPPAQSAPQGHSTTIPQLDIGMSAAETVRDVLPAAANVRSPEFGIRHIPFLSFRGHANINFGDPNAALVLDGAPWAEWRAVNATLLDVESVQIARGPQRSAGGRAAVAGAIHVQSRPPSETWTAEARSEFGNFDKQLYEAVVSGPLVKEKVLFRLAGQMSGRDGFQRNAFDGERPDFRDSLAGKAELLFRPVKDLEIRLRGFATSADDGAPFVDLRGGDPLHVNTEFEGESHTDTLKSALNIRWEAPGFTLTSNTTRQHFAVDHDKFDFDLTPAPFFALSNERTSTQWSQELRAESAPGAELSWTAGGYFEDFRAVDDAFLSFLDSNFLQAPPPAGLGLPFAAPVQDRRQAESHSLTGALFGDAQARLGGGFSLQPGLRLEHRREAFARNTLLVAQGQGVALPSGPAFAADRDTTVVLPSLKLGYDSGRGWKTHLSGARGYRPCGFSHLATEPAVTPFKNEFLWTLEAGMEGAWLNGRLSTTAALFYSLARDYQVRRESTATNIRIDNAERAWMRGAELDLAARPLKELRLSASLGLLQTEYDRFEDRVTGQRFDGQRIPYAADYQAAVRAHYRHEIGFFAGVDYNASGRYRLNDMRPIFQRPYGQLGARIGYERRHLTVFLYGNNLTDSRYSTFLFAQSPDSFIEAPGPPRTFGISMTLKY